MGRKKLPILYKKSSTGALQYWKIALEDNVIHIEYGQVGTSNPQTTSEVISKGKNIGRSNETTPQQQAKLEAQSRWKKQIERRGYTRDKAKAELGQSETNAPVPMLAEKFQERGHKMTFPAVVQPKMDGIRCLAVKDGNDVRLYSRRGVLFTGLGHISAALMIMDWPSNILDGEIYSHKYKQDFEHITGIARTHKSKADHEDMEYHIFDYVSDEPYKKRYHQLRSHFQNKHESIKVVKSFKIEAASDLESFYDQFAEDKYEGVILRCPNAPYHHKRTDALQKYKLTDDTEFVITGMKEGRGRCAGHCIFTCQKPDGTEFEAKLKGELSFLQYIWQHPDEFIGKELTVQHQGYTKYGLPRFPVGKAIRDYE